MIAVAEARSRVASRLAKLGREWAADPAAAASASVRIALHPPSEREALEHQAAVIAWRDAWASVAAEPGVALEWVTRTWPRVGTQTVPTHAAITGADALARFAGPVSADAWARLRDRIAIAIARLGEAASTGDDPTIAADGAGLSVDGAGRTVDGAGIAVAVRSNATALVGYADAEFATVLEVIEWLVVHSVEGMRPRQLPIRGVDSKWFGSHRAVVSALVLAASGRDTLGIVGDAQQFRTRLLDERILPDAPRAFAASVEELATLSIRPRTVLVLENLESLLALPAMSDVIAVHGNGFSAAELARVPWLLTSPILYWGDLDSNGFAILHRLRTAVPTVRSVLMDEQVLLAHRDLWVPEPTPARGTYPTLTPAEQMALDRLRDEGDVRLEQERIPWAFALEQLEAALEERAEHRPDRGVR